MSLTPTEIATLIAAAGMMIPPSAAYAVPGADDPAIIADLTRTVGRDLVALQRALAALGNDFAAQPAPVREARAATFRAAGGADLALLTRLVMQAYYRDDRVVRSLGRETRPPFPLGNAIAQGDWSLLEPVKARAPFWRRVE